MSSDRDSRTIRRRVVYSGRVQGVGFRYTANAIARRHPVSGSVRNCADGTVELEAQGTASAVDEFLAEISRRFEGNIVNCEVADVPVQADSGGFSIRH